MNNKFISFVINHIYNVFLEHEPIGLINSFHHQLENKTIIINFNQLLEYNFQINSNHIIYDEKSFISIRIANLIKEIQENPKTFNYINLTFLNKLIDYQKYPEQILESDTKNINFTIDSFHKSEIIKQYTEVGKKYGFKEFAYLINKNLNSKDNYDKSQELLNKTIIEIEKILINFNIKNPIELGNNILSLYTNDLLNSSINARFHPESNKIFLRDSEQLELIHEYTHFLDKNTAALLLTGHNTRELFELKICTIKDLQLLDLNTFSQLKIEYNFSSITNNIKYKDGIKLNNNINKLITNTFSETTSNQVFYDILIKYISNLKTPNSLSLIEAIDNVLLNNNSNNKIEHLNETEKSLYSYALTFQNNKPINFYSFWARYLDKHDNCKYYQTQKEILARIVDFCINKNFTNIQFEMTTPKITEQKKQNELFEILQSCHTIIKESQQTHMITKFLKIQKEFQNNKTIQSKINPSLFSLWFILFYSI